jgi:CHAT domain-containing protein/tetratricopeptide (TPR) repeat protein
MVIQMSRRLTASFRFLLSLLVVGIRLSSLGISGPVRAQSPEPSQSAAASEQSEASAEATRLNGEVLRLLGEGRFAEAVPQAERALTIRKQVLGVKHPLYAQSLNNLAMIYLNLDDYARAEPLLTENRSIIAEVFGKENVQYGKNSINLGLLYWNKGDYVRCEPLFIEAAAIIKETLGTKHPLYATSLSNLAMMFQRTGDYGRAERHYVEVVAIAKEAHGTKHNEYAKSLNNLAVLYQKMGAYGRAEPLFVEALAIRKEVLGPKHPEYGLSLGNLAELFRNMADYARAEPLYLEALSIRKDVFGVKHGAYAASLNNLGLLYVDMGDYARAEPRFVEALAIRKDVLGEKHSEYAQSLGNLGYLYWNMGDYGRAEPLFVAALSLRKEVLGVKHPDYALSLGNLATLYQSRGDYARAEPISREACSIQKLVHGARHPMFATSLSNLALLYQEMGDRGRSEPLYEEVLSIQKEVFGAKHPAYALTLNNLAEIYRSRGEYGRSETLYVESLSVRKEVLGPRHPDCAQSLGNLADLYRMMGDHRRAEPLLVEALSIHKESLGVRHPDYATSLNNLAKVYQETGEYARSEPLLVEAAAVYRDMLGAKHQYYAQSLQNLAELHQCSGDYARAGPLHLEAVEITLANLASASVIQSERQQLAMGSELRHHLDGLLSTAVASGDFAEEAYAAVLRWKGAVLDRQQTGRRLRMTGDPRVVELLERLQSTAGRVATAALAVPAPPQQAVWRKQIDRWTAEKERLEAELSARSTAFRNRRAAAARTPADVRRALADGQLLIDCLEFSRLFRVGPGKPPRFERHLAAFVLRRDRSVELIDLGPTAAIAANVDTWRQSLGAGDEAAAAATKLKDQVWRPLAPHLGDVQMVLISPDGALARFPMGALPGKQPGTFLLEDVGLVIVPIPQRIADSPQSRIDEAPTLLTLGDVDYGRGSDSPSPADVAMRGNEAAFAPLEGAARESEAIDSLFARSFADGRIRTLRQGRANESEFRAAASQSRYLHLATHGYFAPPQVRSALSIDESESSADDFEVRLGGAREVAGFHPGLLSGLALAGANRPPEAGRDDGILTALEAAELDLDGVELVTLSACETGLGATAGGEGLLGLQRAFQTAGARHVVASLWKVDDEATAVLMRLFYENLWLKKLSIAESLRQAQLSVLRRPELIASGTARGLGAAKPLLGGAAAAEVKSPSGRTDASRWAAFQLSGSRP